MEGTFYELLYIMDVGTTSPQIRNHRQGAVSPDQTHQPSYTLNDNWGSTQ